MQDDGGGAFFSVYNEELGALSTQAPAARLVAAAGSGLLGDALLEQFQRAEAYVARHLQDFSSQAVQQLEVRPNHPCSAFVERLLSGQALCTSLCDLFFHTDGVMD